MKKTIALLTDFGLVDNYVGIMKGVILKINPRVQIIDITHQIPAQDIGKGTLTLQSAYPFFSAQTIFMAVVDPGVGSTRKAVILKTKDYYFVAPDNGLLAPIIAREKKCKLYSIQNKKFCLSPLSATFHGRDIFAPVAAYISKGVKLSEFGPRQYHWAQYCIPQAKVFINERKIEGEIVDIDHFGNLITNIKRNQIKFSQKNIRIHIKRRILNKISEAYSSENNGHLLALFGSMDYLEISINGGSASEKLKVSRGDGVKISF